MNSVLSFVLIN